MLPDGFGLARGIGLGWLVGWFGDEISVGLLWVLEFAVGVRVGVEEGGAVSESSLL